MTKARDLKTAQVMRAETIALLTYLEQRGVSERAALAVMGFAITTLICDPEMLENFIKTLRRLHAADHAN